MNVVVTYTHLSCCYAAVPFKNDAVKKAVLREQMKLEATKMGVPVEIVAATQHRLQHEDEAADPFAKMMVRGDKTERKSTRVEADGLKPVANGPRPLADGPRPIADDLKLKARVSLHAAEHHEDVVVQEKGQASGSCAVM